MTNKNITKIVITGGPCSGKSTGMSYLAQKLGEYGYGVIVVPEFATEVMMAGCKPGSTMSLYDFEELLLVGQIEREKVYFKAAERLNCDKVVVLLDRGTLDVKAYTGNKWWTTLLHDHSLHEIELRDRNYDAVIHLRTAALGAEDFYTTANNEARLESPEEAREKCHKTLDAWIGHPHLHVVDNSTAFDAKMKRALQAVLHTLGEPVPLEIERKFLVDPSFDVSKIPNRTTTTNIEQAYLPDGWRIRRRGKGGAYLYTKTHKEETHDPSVRVERETLISAREYDNLLVQKLPDVPIIRKARTCFVHEEQYFEIDVFQGNKPLAILEIELTDRNASVSLPSWLPIIREVTSESGFKNVEIAKLYYS